MKVARVATGKGSQSVWSSEFGQDGKSGDDGDKHALKS